MLGNFCSILTVTASSIYLCTLHICIYCTHLIISFFFFLLCLTCMCAAEILKFPIGIFKKCYLFLSLYNFNTSIHCTLFFFSGISL